MTGRIILNIIALILAIACAAKLWRTHTWEAHLVEIILAFGGLVAFLFPDEFASWLGYRASRSNQWRFQPEGFVRFSGAVLLVLAASIILVFR
jgi:hypothetical protein